MTPPAHKALLRVFDNLYYLEQQIKDERSRLEQEIGDSVLQTANEIEKKLSHLLVRIYESLYVSHAEDPINSLFSGSYFRCHFAAFERR